MSDFKYINRDYEGFRTEMIDMLQVKMPEYTDTSSFDPGIVLIELFAHMLDILSFYIDIVANEVFLATAKERESVIQHTKMLGYSMSNATPSKFYQVFKLVAVRDTDYTIPKGYRIKTKSATAEEAVYFETDQDLVIPAGALGNEQSEGEYLYKVPITQGYTISNDYLGMGNDTANQEYVLNYSPVIEESLEVYVGTGTYNPIDQTPVYVKWQRVDNFIDSTSESGHYIVSVDENDNMKITFGDGIAGMKPTKEVMAVYRVGGGVIGNIGANTITEMEQTLAVVESTFNPDEAYILGEEKEGIEEAKVKSVAHARTLYRAVTEPDFEDLGLANLDVLKVKAIYNAGTNTVHVYLLPKTVVEFTEGQLATCLAFYNERKLLGINVAVHNPVYVEFNPKLVVKVLPAYINDTTRIRTELDAMLRSEFFAQGYFGFGQSFVASEALAGLMSIKGIKSVYFYETDGVTPILDVDVEDNEILTLSASFSKDTSISFA